MAISEITKGLAASQRRQFQQTIDANNKTIAEYKVLITRMEDENISLKTQQDALKKDIPEPTVTEV